MTMTMMTTSLATDDVATAAVVEAAVRGAEVVMAVSILGILPDPTKTTVRSDDRARGAAIPVTIPVMVMTATTMTRDVAGTTALTTIRETMATTAMRLVTSLSQNWTAPALPGHPGLDPPSQSARLTPLGTG